MNAISVIDHVRCEQCGAPRTKFYQVLNQIILCWDCGAFVLPAMVQIMMHKGFFDCEKFPVDMVDMEGDEKDLQ